MGKISLGNFGQGQTTAPVQHTQLDGRGIGSEFGVLADIGKDISNRAMQYQQQQKAEDDAFTRAKTAKALTDYDLEVERAKTDVANQLQTGVITYKDANARYMETVQKIPAPQIEGQNETLKFTYDGALDTARKRGAADIGNVAENAKRQEFAALFTDTLDGLGKQAGLPGANLDAIDQRMESLRTTAKAAGYTDQAITKAIQDKRDSVYTTHAQQRIISSRENGEALKQIELELTNDKGYYANRLDADKRTALLGTVTGYRIQLENRIEATATKREAAAERAVASYSDQIATGLPIAAELTNETFEKVRGTVYEQDFKDALQHSNEIQTVRQLPFAQQQTYIQQLDATLKTTPTSNPKKEQARLSSLRASMDAAQKVAKENPILFVQQQTGEALPPLDIQALAQPGGIQAIGNQIADRFNAIEGARRKYGPTVGSNPWTPQETEMMKMFFDKADDKQRLQVLGVLQAGSSTPQRMAGALAPLAADKPYLKLAGMAQFQKLRGDSGTELAPTILAGARVLTEKTSIMPSEQKFLALFDESVGDAFPPGSEERKMAYIGFKTMYAGMAGPKGITHEQGGEIDAQLGKEAVSLASGGISEYNDRKVVRPWGMKEEDFSDRVEIEIERLATESGFDVDKLEDMPLMASDVEGQYFLLNGGKKQMKDGKLLIVRVK